MPATHHITLHFPLPSYLSPDLVVEHLQTYEPLITPHPYLLRYHRRQVDLREILDDPFFTETGRKIEAYEVVERVVIVPVPGLQSILSKDVRIPAVFQSFDTGVRCRADAQGGVRVWSTYEVRRRDLGEEFARAGARGGGSGGSGGIGGGREGGDPVVVSPGAGDWELVETARVECSSLVKPFVVKSFEGAHRDLCQKVIDGLIRTSHGKEQIVAEGKAPGRLSPVPTPAVV